MKAEAMGQSGEIEGRADSLLGHVTMTGTDMIRHARRSKVCV
jgi:hypothetical protein